MIPLTLVVFFTSGFAALLYQVAWQRMLVIFSGADVYSATVTVSAYMAGLGIGSLAGGHVADRVTARTSVALFAGAEMAIAVFGFFSTSLYYDLLYQRTGHVAISTAAMASLLFVSLLWPTFFMGASLPLLARAMTWSLDRAARTVGTLYAINTLGAAAGSLIVTWVLLPRVGLDGSVRVAAALNVACALALVPVTLRLRPGAPSTPGHAAALQTPPPPPPALTGDRLGNGPDTVWLWTSIYAVSGLVALSLEIVWFRLLGVMMKSTAFTFGTLLTLYLAGLGLGSLAGSVVAPRLRRPRRVFLGLQASVGLASSALLGVALFAARHVAPMREYFGSYEPLSVPHGIAAVRALATGVGDAGSTPEMALTFLLLYAALPAALVIPVTFLMGFSFPVLQRVLLTDLTYVGRRVGRLLLANVIGSMIGAMLTGWLLLDLIGTSGTFTLLAAIGGGFGLLALGQRERTLAGRKLAMSLAAGSVVLAAIVIGTPDRTALWAAVHGTQPGAMVLGEDGSGLSVLKTRQPGAPGRVVVFVNGMGQSEMPYGDIHTALGAVPAFIHPDPRHAAIIGLGSGDTVYAAAGRPAIERVTAIEIIGPQLDTLRVLSQRHSYAGLTRLLADPRVEHLVGDGRTFLMRGGRRYDLIEADALRPGSAYSGNLYSREYFTLLRHHLNPRGLAATWVPSVRVHNTFVRTFPYVMSVPGILVGSNEPIALDRDAIAARLADPRVADHYGAAGIDISRLMATYLAEPAWYGPDFNRAALTDLNTDLFPKDEYDLAPRR